MRSLPKALAAVLMASAVPALAAPATSAVSAPAPAPVADLVKAVNIPFDQFTLPNGLRVIVHTDRKAPVVALSVWYHVGSRFEPAGKTGYAHLFEHIMFYGSEHAKGEFFKPLEDVGATDYNGTTWFDRTNYYETVPTGALELALFLESDRMGYLLGAVTPEKLANQISVVQNEKRQGDNQPFGLVEYAQLAALFPEGHPYRHSTIGSMKELSAASMADIRNWFKTHYGPNNAVLVLAGDIDMKTARPLVEKWFGAIPRGPETTAPPAPVPTLQADVDKLMHDRIATTRVSRSWVVPGLTDPDRIPLSIAASVLGGLSSSRLDNAMVRRDRTAVGVTASLQPFEKISLFEVSADVRPGVDPARAAAQLDAIMADFLKNGPTADEVRRVATRAVAGTIAGLEGVGGDSGKAVTLAEGAVYADDPAYYRRELAAYAEATPDMVAAAARKWLSRPVFRLTVAPGERDPADVAAAAGEAGFAHRPAYFRQPGQPPRSAAPATAGATVATPPSAGPVQPDRTQWPKVLPVGELDFPPVERTRLSNGIEVVFARRATVPTVRVALSFDAGFAADPKNRLGTHNLTLALLDEGTKTRDSIAIAEAQERLGANVGTSATMDQTSLTLFALKPNLGASLDLLADIARNPAFAPAEVERLRATLLTAIAAEKSEPRGIARRALPPLLYGSAHPYGVPLSGSGEEAGLKAVTRDDLIAFHQRWLRPDNLTIFAVGDTTLADLTPLLEKRFGDWKAPAVPKGAKLFRMDRMARPPRIVLIDRPQSPQSYIMAGQVLPTRGTDDPLTLLTANNVIGGAFTSRLNMDLRETRGWAYGAYSSAALVKENMSFYLIAPVQTDRTGDAIKAMQTDVRAYLTDQGTTPAERDRYINSEIRSLPGSFEDSGAVLSAIARNQLLGRPDDYYTRLPDRYRAMTPAMLDKAARDAVRPDQFIWVVVGDAAKVRPQLAVTGLPVEEMQAR